MHTNEWDRYVLSYRLRSARQKTRSRKEDFEKFLIRLDKRRNKLWGDRQSMPWIPLAEPYQKGWKRFFVLRDDIRRSKEADLYQTLLDKINTIQHSRDKAFRRRKRRMRKYVYFVEKQSLREFNEYEWNSPKCKLTEKEKLLFYRYEGWNHERKYWEVKYIYAEPWRFVLRVRPHMITEQKMIDAKLEAEYRRLVNYIERNHLGDTIYRLTRGRRSGRRSWHTAKPQYAHPFKNKPLHVILYECREATTEL